MDFIKKMMYLFNKREKRGLIILFFLMLLSALFETIGIGLIVPFVGIITNPKMIQTQPILSHIYRSLDFNSTSGFLIFSTIILIFVFIIKNLYIIIFQYFQYRFIYNQQIILSRRMLEHYLTSPYEFHLQRNSSDLLRNVNSEVSRIFNQILMPVFLIATELLVITSIGILLIVKAPIETLLSAAVLGFSTWLFLKVFRPKLSKLGKEQQSSNGEMIKWINQALGSVKDVKVSGREAFFIDAYVEHSERFSKSMRFFQMVTQLPRMFIETIVVIIILFIMLLIILKGIDTNMLLSTLALFAMGAFRLMPSINRIVGSITSIRFNLPALDVIYDELKGSKPTGGEFLIKPYTNGKLFTKEIQLRNIFYKYPNQSDYTLKDVTLTIPIGKSIAFIGMSGAGKTTMVDIILGLLQPDKGQVLIDEIDLRNQLSIWKRKIGYIPQTIYLSDDTIRRNVAFGIKEEEIDDVAVMKALEDAQLMEFVSGLSQGFNTFVGERGVRLSGGQRQRIGIARALYHNPEILFLDEATSALDIETEKEVMKAVDSLKGEKTFIIIAHRLSTIENCDIVYELDNGNLTLNEKIAK